VRRSPPLSAVGCELDGAPRSGRTISDANHHGRGGAFRRFRPAVSLQRARPLQRCRTTRAVEVLPNPDPACVFRVHRRLIACHGILLQDNMDLDGLIAEEVWTYLYTYSPVPIAGATGSIGAPVAVD
jgi:hypothetical protein